MATSKFCVEVVRAHDLAPRDGQGSASVFVVLTFDSQQFRTTVKEEGVNPVWGESFYFDMPNRSNLHEHVLEASVYCVNKSVQGSRSFLGEVRLYGYPFVPYSDAVVTYYLLDTSRTREVTEGLRLKVYIIDEASITAQEPKIASLDSAAIRLCVEVVSAHDLMPNDEQGSASSCVEVSFDSDRRRTSVKEKDLNPVWNERFYFNVWDPSNLPDLDIQAYVYHVDSSFKQSNTPLGQVRIAGSSCGPFPDAVVMHYPLLKPEKFVKRKADLGLKVYTIDDPSIRTSNPSPSMNTAICSPDLQLSNNLGSILQNQFSRPHNIPFQHLKEITNNFCDERILGQGGFGVVYKGVLENGEMIAVKKMVSPLISGSQEQFQNEVYHLMMLKHPNIVRFVGYCYDIQYECLECNGKYVFAEAVERLLCLEYLPKGSLDKYISDESSGLDWSTRYNIIEGICYGLCHLHEQIDKPIIHLDLKPANILLDNRMVPKITDFGLSRLLDQQETICTKSRDGTLGYMPPEFFHGGTITPKSDIFSLGVIIMEIIAGRKPDITEKSSYAIKMETLKNWKDVLQRSPAHGSLEMDWEQLKRCVHVGLICMNPDRTKRPPITKVINMLHGLESMECDISNLLALDVGIFSPISHISNNLESLLHDQSSKPRDMPLQYLKEITNNFSDERILGKGGSIVVYKGVLQNGEIIAVKKIVSSWMPGLQKQFENEVSHHMRLKHPNIVHCVGYCYETRNVCLEYNGKHIFAEMVERIVCLEYLPKGSLYKFLSAESSRLDWSTYYNIIQGICYGLCYLHEELDDPIVHLDLKPANILLDDNMVPKITDFGLSRLLDQNQTICTLSRDGTFAYMAPEYLHEGKITCKSDIFSLGVIMLEVVTGHRDYPDVTTASSNGFIVLTLEKWRNVLRRSSEHGSLEMDLEQIKRCIQVGLICVNPRRTKRPTITNVINMLHGLESIDCGISNEAT